MIRGAVIGLIAGLLCAFGGALKDMPHEGFKPLTFIRSPIVGIVWGIVASYVTVNFFLILCFSGYLERATVEGWKIIRQRKPSKFA